MPYSGFEPEPTRLQAEGHIHHTGWEASDLFIWNNGYAAFKSGNFDISDSHRPGKPTTLDNDVIKGASGSKFVSENRGIVKCSYSTLVAHPRTFATDW
ncbi:UNVERIFIED_CONTAM: hypothetical protein NCL1_20848 [Trichonephila clavipes]